MTDNIEEEEAFGQETHFSLSFVCFLLAEGQGPSRAPTSSFSLSSKTKREEVGDVLMTMAHWALRAQAIVIKGHLILGPHPSVT